MEVSSKMTVGQLADGRDRPDLLDALAPWISTDNKRLPCAVLRLIIQGRRVNQYKREKRQQALLLLGLYVQFTQQLLDDGVLSVYTPGRRRWARDLRHRPIRIAASSFAFASPRFDDTVRLPFRSQKFLYQLPHELIEHVGRWAPPVVSVNGDGRVSVIQNVLSAFLAQWVLPEGAVWCRSLTAVTKPRFSMTDLCCYVYARLFPLFDRYRVAIAQSALNLEQGQLVTGQSRATVARARSTRWAGP